MSLPTWERGLKREVSDDIVTYAPSLPTWERGLKLVFKPTLKRVGRVAPHVGAWIETDLLWRELIPVEVAPHVGAWIETACPVVCVLLVRVAPHVGAWIETKSEPTE